MSWIGKTIIVAACFGLCVSAACVADVWNKTRSPSVSQLHDVVSKHLLALRTSEYSAAYTQTSRTIRVRYDMDAFRGMLHHHYVPVFSARRIEFGEATVRGGLASLRTYLIDGMDRVTPCTYHLVREHGVWRISGVTIQPTWPVDFRLGGLRA